MWVQAPLYYILSGVGRGGAEDELHDIKFPPVDPPKEGPRTRVPGGGPQKRNQISWLVFGTFRCLQFMMIAMELAVPVSPAFLFLL